MHKLATITEAYQFEVNILPVVVSFQLLQNEGRSCKYKGVKQDYQYHVAPVRCLNVLQRRRRSIY